MHTSSQKGSNLNVDINKVQMLQKKIRGKILLKFKASFIFKHFYNRVEHIRHEMINSVRGQLNDYREQIYEKS